MRALACFACSVALLAPFAARADDPAIARPRPPYSIPWQLRPVLVVNGARLDTSAGRYEDTAAQIGTAIVSNLSAGARIPNTGRPGEGFGINGRIALASNAAPAGRSATIVSNPFVGLSYGRGHEAFHANASVGAAVPVGGGGGNHPSVRTLDARARASATRMAMDGSLYATNDVAFVGGLDFAYVDHGLTVQLEGTLFELIRVRGAAAQPEATKTNFTSGAHVGYFVAPWFSLGAEIRYQRWVNPPFQTQLLPATIDQASFAAGSRFHVRLGNVAWLRPGLAYSRGIDRPLAAATPNFHVLQLDVPVIFQ